MSNVVLRLAVGEEKGRRSSVWRIWFGPNDVYAAFRSVAGIRKASIHYERSADKQPLRYIGYTKEYAAPQFHGVALARGHRTHAEWPGDEFAPGFFAEFRFRIPESELRPLSANGAGDVVWLPSPPTGMATEVLILSGPKGYKGLVPWRSDGGLTDCIFDDTLDSGKRIWIVHHTIPAPPASEIRAMRQVALQALAQTGSRRQPIGKNSRLSFTMNCLDGTFSEVEIASA